VEKNRQCSKVAVDSMEHKIRRKVVDGRNRISEAGILPKMMKPTSLYLVVDADQDLDSAQPSRFS